MNNNEKSLFWICVILTMGMALTALMISLPRTVDVQNPTRLDYQGTIVAIFALLVTVLIGWQIYNALDMAKRVRRNDMRVNIALNRIIRERQRIDHLGQISQGYNNGNYFSLLALVQYYEILSRRKNGLIRVTDAARQLRNCYMLNARAMTHYFDVLDTNPELTEEISIAINVCVDNFQLSSVQLFGKRYANIIGSIFENQDHETCDMYYRNIMQHSNLLQSEQIDTINTYRVQRRALIPSKQPPSPISKAKEK